MASERELRRRCGCPRSHGHVRHVALGDRHANVATVVGGDGHEPYVWIGLLDGESHAARIEAAEFRKIAAAMEGAAP